MDFWAGIFVGWIIGAIGTGIVIMFFAGAGANRTKNWLDEEE